MTSTREKSYLEDSDNFAQKNPQDEHTQTATQVNSTWENAQEKDNIDFMSTCNNGKDNCAKQSASKEKSHKYTQELEHTMKKSNSNNSKQANREKNLGQEKS